MEVHFNPDLQPVNRVAAENSSDADEPRSNWWSAG
jgi:hypothetical protein